MDQAGTVELEMTREEIAMLLRRIACPTLLLCGEESWATSPAEDGDANVSVTQACCPCRAMGTECDTIAENP